jgi:integrase
MSTPNQSNLGSVYQRSDGRWVAALSVGSKRICRYAHSRKDANEALLALLKERGAGTLVRPSATTLAEWVDEWLTMVEPNLRPKTLSVYRDALAPVVAHLGHQKVSKLSALSLASTFATLQRQGRGKRSLQQSYAYLRACLDRAVALQLLGENPLRRVARPMYQPAERRIWSTDEANRFVAVAAQSQHRYAPLLIFLAGTGCRLSEGLGLSWDAINWQDHTARIHRSLVVVDSNTILQQPKTRAGVRTVGLPGFVLQALQRLPRPLSEESLVFQTGRGTSPTKRNLLRSLRALCVQAHVPVVSLHSLRHLNASLALASGVPLPDVSKHLGHAHPGVTSRIYAHALGDGRAVVRALEQALDSLEK